MPEVILGAGKTPEHIIGVASRLKEAGENVLITRLAPEAAPQVVAAIPELRHSVLGRTASLVQRPIPSRGGKPVIVVTAGTSDIPVAEEALETLRMGGVPAESVYSLPSVRSRRGARSATR